MSVDLETGAACGTAFALAGFAAIDLGELVQRAQLMARTDRKYILPRCDLPAVLSGLTSDVQVLQIDGRREFNYESVYFDTPDLDCYLAAAHRRRRRFKLRIRSYVDSQQHFLEVKTRGQRGSTLKQRIPYAGDSLDPGSRSRAHVDDVLAEAGIPSAHLRFAPALTTRYRRSTLFLPQTQSRVTIDTGLCWALPGADPTARGLDHVIVETKSERAVSPVDRLLWGLKYRPCALSKYATGLAALRPELPSNRWTPLLRRQFSTLTKAGNR